MLYHYRRLEYGEFIVVGCDTSAGLGDYSTAQFLSRTNLDVPMVYHSKGMANEMTNKLHTVFNDVFNQTGIAPMVAYERNNGGVFEMERLAELNRLNKYRIFQMPSYGSVNNPLPRKLGWDTNTATRPKMLSDLKDMIDKRLLKLYHRPTVDEMFSFIVTQTSTTWKAQAEKGAHDDLVMSLAIAVQLYQNCEPESLIQEDPPDDTQLFDEKGFY